MAEAYLPLDEARQPLGQRLGSRQLPEPGDRHARTLQVFARLAQQPGQQHATDSQVGGRTVRLRRGPVRVRLHHFFAAHERRRFAIDHGPLPCGFRAAACAAVRVRSLATRFEANAIRTREQMIGRFS